MFQDWSDSIYFSPGLPFVTKLICTFVFTVRRPESSHQIWRRRWLRDSSTSFSCPGSILYWRNIVWIHLIQFEILEVTQTYIVSTPQDGLFPCRIRDDIDTYHRLNFHLYQALRKALFKPGAFFKVSSFLFFFTSDGLSVFKQVL